MRATMTAAPPELEKEMHVSKDKSNACGQAGEMPELSQAHRGQRNTSCSISPVSVPSWCRHIQAPLSVMPVPCSLTCEALRPLQQLLQPPPVAELVQHCCSGCPCSCCGSCWSPCCCCWCCWHSCSCRAVAYLCFCSCYDASSCFCSCFCCGGCSSWLDLCHA